jgi:hypothetical protein
MLEKMRATFFPGDERRHTGSQCKAQPEHSRKRKKRELDDLISGLSQKLQEQHRSPKCANQVLMERQPLFLIPNLASRSSASNSHKSS